MNFVIPVLSLCRRSSSGCQGTFGEGGSLIGARGFDPNLRPPENPGIASLLLNGIWSKMDSLRLFGFCILVGDGGVFKIIRLADGGGATMGAEEVVVVVMEEVKGGIGEVPDDERLLRWVPFS